MNERAQAGLEYLMTYGWALILVATIVVVLAFIVQFKPTTTFVSSDPTKIMLKSAGVSGNTAGIVLQNATGGKITINSITFSGDVLLASGSKLNGQSWPTFPVDLIAGGEIRLDGLNAANGAANARIAINYKDYADFEREARVTSGSAGPEGIAAAYSFEGSAFDGSGNNNGATVHPLPGVFPDAGCVNEKCFSLDGLAGTYAEGSANVANESYTYTAWIKPTDFTCAGYWNNCEIISKYSGVDGIWFDSFWISSATKVLTGSRKTDSGTFISSSSSATIAEDQWQFVAASLDNTVGWWQRKIVLYINGKDVTPASAYTANGALSDSSGNPVKIGKGFKGLIDEVRIYNRALSAAEICNECKRFATGAGITCSC